MKKHLVYIPLLFVTLSLIAQENNNVNVLKETVGNNKSIYREVAGFGLGRIAFRDFATSPLIYKGGGISIATGKRKTDANKEIYFSVRGLFGLSNIDVAGKSNASLLTNFDVSYSRLYTLKKISNDNWTYKIGGTINMATISRINLALQNNAAGFEVFPALLGSFKVDKKFSRHPFLRKKKPAKKQQLSLTLDIGVVNTTLRNGYAYTLHAPFYNDTNILKDYEFNWFAGFRMRTTLAYTIYSNKNKNGVRFSYRWEGIRSGLTPDRFSLSTGIFQYTLLHRLN